MFLWVSRVSQGQHRSSLELGSRAGWNLRILEGLCLMSVGRDFVLLTFVRLEQCLYTLGALNVCGKADVTRLCWYQMWG